MEEEMLALPWLESLLSASFFTVCSTHTDTPRNECNMFCLDCKKDAFCFYCRTSRHDDHSVIQIRRSSYHDVVRVSEIQKVLDISGVQTYVINSARVLFLNERQQLKAPTTKTVSHLCEICGRSLLDPYRFCSLGCKLVGVKRNGDATLIISSSKIEQETMEEKIELETSRKRLRAKVKEEGEGEGEEEEEATTTSVESCETNQLQEISRETSGSPSRNSNSRRRKGIPHRAPFIS